MKNDFDLDVKKILKQAENEMFELNHPYVGSEHMMLAVLKSKTNASKVLLKNNLDYKHFKENLIKVVGRAHKKSEIALYTPLLKRIIALSLENAREKNNEKVKPEHLIISMLEEGEGVCIRILLNMGIDLEKVYSDMQRSIKSTNDKPNLLVYEIGKLMTPNKEAIYKREEEINRLIEILLRKNKNNPLLVGEAGVGKTAIVEELVRLINLHQVPEFLENYKVVELDTGSLISGTRYRGDFEDRLNKIIKELVDEKNIIIFIDEIHTLVNCGGAEGAIDAANILKPYLARGDIKVIGATTMKEYKNTIAKDKALDRRFQLINVEEPNCKNTEYILMHIKENYEKHHNVIISDENIKDIVKYADKYIFNRFNPDKSIDILDSVCAHVQLMRPNQKNALSELERKKEKMLIQKKYKEVLETELKIKKLEENTDKIQISKKDILRVIEYKANMPLLDNFETKLNSLSTLLKTSIYGQDTAIDEISDALKEKYLVDNSKPLSILITGPSGVGKTFTSKVIAGMLFGERHFLRLDMSEFSNETSISKLIGTSQGYIGYDDECLLSKIKDYPYSIILLDEIEKASPKVQNLFSEIIEEGFIHNGKGEEIHFENTTLIITSGLSFKKGIGFNSYSKPNNDCIKDELLSRITKVINYKPISVDAAKKYLKRETAGMKLTKEEITKIINNANIEKNGIRGMQKELNKYKIKKLLIKV